MLNTIKSNHDEEIQEKINLSIDRPENYIRKKVHSIKISHKNVDGLLNTRLC
jgi:hypothetical protein